MKGDDKNSLIYHSLHGRHIRGCLPLFMLLALVAVGGLLWVVPIRQQERVRPRGEGEFYHRNDDFTNYMVRQSSPLPLQLPLVADPEFLEDSAARYMPLRREAQLRMAPAVAILPVVPDSAVISAEKLLALPPESQPEGPNANETAQPAEPPVPGEEVRP